MVETKLEHYLKACVPLIYVRTSEDSRAVKYIMEATEKANLSDCWVGEWSANKGLIINGTAYQNPDIKNIKDMGSALTYLTASEDTGVLILHNIRQFISNFLAIQNLKDAAMICRIKGSYIILIGAELEFPPEIKDLVTVYDYPLPKKEFFYSLFSEMASNYKEGMDLPKNKKDQDVLLEKASDAALGMTAIQGENAFALSIVKTKSIDIQTIYAEKEQVIKQSDVLELIPVRENSNTLGGFNQFKPWAEKRKNAFNPEAIRYGLSFPKGVLFCGLAGCGKSLCCEVLASIFGLPLISFDVGKVFRKWQGQSESAVRQAFRVAEAAAPCVLRIEEIDKSMAVSGSSGGGGSESSARVIQTILTWMQEKTRPVYVTATTNNVDLISPELMRKGRFDEIFGVDLPVCSEREEIFAIHIQKRNRDIVDYDCALLARQSDRFTGAEIEAAIEDAMATAFSEGVREFTTEDILNSIKETIPQSESQKEKIAAIREWITTRTRQVSKQSATNNILEKTRKIRKT